MYHFLEEFVEVSCTLECEDVLPGKIPHNQYSSRASSCGAHDQGKNTTWSKGKALKKAQGKQ